jgi:mevalonate kinase
MFPAMIQGCVPVYIDKWSQVPGVLAWKMPGAGGGGYLVCVVSDAETFAKVHPEAIRLTIRRAGF